jgi:O-6-methylguanine DNA methyltransferase
MEKLISIASSPHVGVKVDIKGGALQRITLFLYSGFVLQTSTPLEPVVKSLISWLKEYAEGKWAPYQLPSQKSSFTQKAADFLQRVPPGQVISYQELAHAIGHPQAARAIGNFCRGNLFPLLIPCHRVVPLSGRLGAFTPDPRIKQQLLQFEGIILSN